MGTWIEGNPDHGSIRFTEKGVYALTASVTDATSRVFADTADIIIYPVGSAGFYLPEIFHTDKTVHVEAIFSEIGSHTAKWSLTRDGKEVSLADMTEGMLDNSGGELKIHAKGSYILKAEFTDDGGRSYSYEQSFVVYPVPAVSYSLPKQAHTDSDIAIQAETADLEGLTIEWLVDNTFGFQDWSTYVDGKLTNDGGTLRFKRAGIYELVARVTDETGRVFLYESGEKCEVLPVLTIGFELPDFAYTDTAIDLRTHGNNQVLPVEWSVSKEGRNIPLTEAFEGILTAQGGKITFKDDGEYVLTASMTDYLKRSYSHSESIRILPVVQYVFTMPQTVHYGTEFDVVPKDVQHIGSYSVVWTLQKEGSTASYQGTLDNEGGKIAVSDIGDFTLTASVTDSAGRVASYSESITVTNTAPNAPVVEAVPTRTVKDGKFLVNITASADDPDGDAVTLEYADTTADSYYTPGTHTIRVRAKDIAGAYSPWTEKTFTITSSAPVVTLTAIPTRTAKDGKFLVNINAEASDADGDATTLEWENKMEDNYYAVGTHTIRVRAKDATELYSEWVSKTFTITNSAPLRRSLPEPQAVTVYRREPWLLSRQPALIPMVMILPLFGRAEMLKPRPTSWEEMWSVLKRWTLQALNHPGLPSESLWLTQTAAVVGASPARIGSLGKWDWKAPPSRNIPLPFRLSAVTAVLTSAEYEDTTSSPNSGISLTTAQPPTASHSAAALVQVCIPSWSFTTTPTITVCITKAISLTR